MMMVHPKPKNEMVGGTAKDETLLQFYHVPSRSKYSIVNLTTATSTSSSSTEMKNEAFALLYREYIANAKVPWDIPIDNPSCIRIETRTVGGVQNVPVLVDDFEESSIMVGILSEEDSVDGSDGGGGRSKKNKTKKKLVGTARMLVRNKMVDGKLEIERYDTLPEGMREVIKEKCTIELNRLAMDGCMKGKKSAPLLIHALLSTAFGHGILNGRIENDIVFTVQKGYLKRFKCRFQHAPFGNPELLGSFKYSEDDPYPVYSVVYSCRGFGRQSLLYALSGGSIPLGIPTYHFRKIGTASTLIVLQIVMMTLIILQTGSSI